MGRTMLIVVIWMGTVYAGIVGAMQNRMFYLPEIITRNIITKQAENVSDYALRIAIRDGNYLRITQMAEHDTSSTIYTYTDDNEYRIQDSRIDSLTFVFESATGTAENLIKRYIATSYVTGELMDRSIGYVAKVAYELSFNKQFENIYHSYFSMDAKNWKNLSIDDGSGNHYDAQLIGNNVKSRKNTAMVGDACAEFNVKGNGVGDSFMYHMEHQLPVTETFTLSTWIILPSDVSSRMTIAWIPPRTNALGGASNYTGPYGGSDFINRPTGAIYTQNGVLYFEANTADGQTLLLNTTIPRTDKTNNMHKANWTHVAMTYDHGIMKAYKSGELIGTAMATNYPVEAVENWGLYIGARPTNPGLNNLQFTNVLVALIDELGFSPYVLSTNDLVTYYATIATPPRILYFRD